LGRIPDVNLGVEKDLQDCLLIAGGQQQFNCAHDVSDGGLAIALAECCMAGNVGVTVDLDEMTWDGPGTGATGRADLALFGETPTLVIVTTPFAGVGAFRALCQSRGLLCNKVGIVGGDSLNITAGGRTVTCAVSDLKKTYEAALPRVMGD
jgi:phosphoribosylformylglycinamidine synthase